MKHCGFRDAVLGVFLAMASVVTGNAASLIAVYDSNGNYSLSSPPPDAHFILLDIPEAFRYGATKTATRTRGAQILTFYPSLTPALDNAHREDGLECSGICNGRILVSIEFRPNLVNSNSPNMADFVARSQLRYRATPPFPSNVTVESLPPHNGFDAGFERTTVPLKRRQTEYPRICANACCSA